MLASSCAPTLCENNMTFWKPLLLGSLALSLSSCLVLPQTEPKAQDCELATRSWTLTVVNADVDAQVTLNEMQRLSASDCDRPECLILVAPALAVSAGSAIVSGSVMVVGNSLHWLERQGRCDDSTTRQAVSVMRGSLESVGGWVLETGGDVMDWFQEQAGL